MRTLLNFNVESTQKIPVKVDAKTRWKNLQEYVLKGKYKTFLNDFVSAQTERQQRKLRLPSDLLIDEEDSAGDKFTKAVTQQIMKMRMVEKSNSIHDKFTSIDKESVLRDEEAYQIALAAVLFPIVDHQALLTSTENLTAPEESASSSLAKSIHDHLGRLVGQEPLTASSKQLEKPLKVTPAIFKDLKFKIKQTLKESASQQQHDQVYAQSLLKFYDEMIKKRGDYVLVSGSSYEDLIVVFNAMVKKEIQSIPITVHQPTSYYPYSNLEDAVFARVQTFVELLKQVVEDVCFEEMAMSKQQRRKTRNALQRRSMDLLSHKRNKSNGTALEGSAPVQVESLNQESVILSEWLKQVFLVGRSTHEKSITKLVHSKEPLRIEKQLKKKLEELLSETYLGFSQDSFQLQECPAAFYYLKKLEKAQISKYISRVHKLYLPERLSPTADLKDDLNTNNEMPLKKWSFGKKKKGSVSKLKIRVIEAKGLAIKDEDGSSDPYVVVEYGSEQRYETEVVSQSLIPLWDQEVMMQVRSHQSKPLTVTVWDKDDPNNVSILSHKYWKDEADDFLGQVHFNVDSLLTELRMMPGKKYDRWFELEKRSKRSHVSGEIRLEIFLEKDGEEQKEPQESAEIEEDILEEEIEERPLVHFANPKELYIHLLSKLLQFDAMNTIGSLGEGSLSQSSEAILEEVGVRYRLDPVWRQTSYFEQMSRRYMNPIQAKQQLPTQLLPQTFVISINALMGQYQKVEQLVMQARTYCQSVYIKVQATQQQLDDGKIIHTPPVVSGIGDFLVTDDELKEYGEVLKELIESQKLQIQNYRDFFPCDTPTGALVHTLSMLSTILQSPWVHPELNMKKKLSDSGLNVSEDDQIEEKEEVKDDWQEVLNELLRTGALERYLKFNQQLMTFDESDIVGRTLKLAQLIADDLDNDMTYFQRAFAA